MFSRGLRLAQGQLLGHKNVLNKKLNQDHAQKRLWNVPEVRVAVAQLALLRLIDTLQPVVALAPVPELVLTDDVENAEDGEQRDADLGDQVDGVPDGVVWCVGGHVGPSTRIVSIVLRESHRLVVKLTWLGWRRNCRC